MNGPCGECGNYDARISACGNDFHDANPGNPNVDRERETTMTELDPLLKEVRKIKQRRNRFFLTLETPSLDEIYQVDTDLGAVAKALEAVLAIPEETYLPTSSKGYFHSGRNSMRDDIRTAITQALGVEQ